MNLVKHILLLLLLLAWLAVLQIHAQVGIGTATPQATLDVNGTIKVGAVSNGVAAKGTIRWNEMNKDFEGYNGTGWVSLTGAKGSWGSDISMVNETDASAVHLQFDAQGTNVGKHLGSSMTMINHYLVAGAPADFSFNGSTANSGTVRIMRKTQGQWSSFHTLFSPDGNSSNGRFGSSVHSINSHFIVGANSATVGGNFAQGKAFIYAMNLNGDLALQGQLTAPDGTGSDNLGTSVAMTSSFAIAGAPGKTISGKVNQGSAYIFQRNNITNTWAYHSTLQPPDGQDEDLFGGAVAISGTVAAVSSYWADHSNMFLVGKVYIYRLVNNVWTYAQTILPPTLQSFAKFGISMAMSGDTLVVGSTQYNGSGSTGNGKVYVYVNANNTMNLLTTVEAGDGRKGDGFGSSVHFANGYLIVGAPYANTGATEDQGKAYIFKRSGDSYVQQAILKASNGRENDRFGHAVVVGANGAAVSSIFSDYKNNEWHGRIYYYEE